MKQSLLTLSICFSMMFFLSCNKDEAQQAEDDVILLSNRDELTKALIIPGKKILPGSLPATTAAATSNFLFNSVQIQKTGNGATTLLKFSVSQAVSGMYLQILGANSFIEVPIAQRPDGMVLVPITVPNNVRVDTKSFTIKYKVFMSNGTVSNELQMNYDVTVLPIGEVVVSLAWNTHADLTMTIELPKGTVIVGERASSIYGGTYFIYERYKQGDCNDSYVPQVIFWEDVKFNGTYHINVQHTYGLQCKSDYFITINSKNISKVFQGLITEPGTEQYVTSFTVNGDNIKF